jgi:hypothetical protein
MTEDKLNDVFAFDVVAVASGLGVSLVNNLGSLTANDSLLRFQKPTSSSSSDAMCACVSAGNSSGFGLTTNLNCEGRCLHAKRLKLERNVVLELKLKFNLVSYDVDERSVRSDFKKRHLLSSLISENYW